MNGKKTWIIPDGYMNPTKNGDFNSHEASCVLNLSGKEAHIDIKIFLEDREPLCGFKAECKNERTNHIRLDKIVSENGDKIPFGISYAVLVESDTDIVVQHSRMDVSQAEMALMSTIAY